VNIALEMPVCEVGGAPCTMDAKGGYIPVSKVKPEHIEEDELVRRLAIKAVAINEQLVGLRAEIFDDVAAFRSLLAEQYGAKKGGAKGNITLSTIDGSLSLILQVSDTLAFGPELQVAKELIDGCIRKWAEGTNDNIRVLIDDAFQVEKTGKISTDRVLGLRRLNIDDPEWSRAMDAISDAVRVTHTKTHARFYQRNPQTEENDRIALDLANA